MKILITGGAGFVGSRLAHLFRDQYPQARIVAFDNLKRRGSELNLPAFQKRQIQFVHGDIRNPADFEELSDSFDLMIEASAEPSVLAGLHGSPLYAIDTNLGGTINCLEFARRKCNRLVFLSTSRVYSLPRLLQIPLVRTPSRFEVSADQPRYSKGIAEDFPTDGYRSIYGTTKLASEMLIEEYVHTYGLQAVINRCGVICGPWQMGKVDQGVFTLWMARHTFGGSLKYTGFGGEGHQVRDLLHPRDLFELIEAQLGSTTPWRGDVFNVGGGLEQSVSLQELTEICRNISGRSIEIKSVPTTSSVDIPYFVTNYSKASSAYDWRPRIRVPEIIKEINHWLITHQAELKHLFGKDF